MTAKKYVFLVLSAVIFSFSFKVTAQVSSDWKILYLDVAAHTIVDGVEVYAQINKCKDEDVVQLKLVNHNPYAVKAKWLDAVQTPDLKWIKKEGALDKKSVTIEAASEIKGECPVNSYSECTIKLKNFIESQQNFKQYAVYHFQVIPITK